MTLRQPWAWAVIHAGKDIENRLWRPTDRSKCRLIIQAATTLDYDGVAELEDMGIIVPDHAMTRGLIAGMVTVDDWHYQGPSRWKETGYFHWHFTRPVAADRVVAMRGARRLFTPPEGWQEAFREYR